MFRFLRFSFISVLVLSFFTLFIPSVKADDIEELEKSLEKQELEEDLENDDYIDEVELKRELENLSKDDYQTESCKPIIKTKVIYKKIPANCNCKPKVIYKTNPKSCDEINKYYITKKYSIYDVVMINQDSLKLTDEQIKAIQYIHTRVMNKILDKKAKINIVSRKLDTFVRMENLNAVRGALIQIAKLKLEISLLDIIEYIKIRKILTDKQKEILEKLVEW